MNDTLGLFEGFGIELEYMIVDRSSLAVRGMSDQILCAIAGAFESEVEVGDLAWSNELALHVIELKTNGPRPSLRGLAASFARDVVRINGLLEPLGALLMPTAMHPWMDPETDTRLWPHEYSRVYEGFDRTFGCRGHGWVNLQSMHINLPFSSDEEFGRLHAAIRLVLPILPALAASSPLADGRTTGLLDSRLDYYKRNCIRVPSVTGQVIPERVFTEEDYRHEVLEPMYADIRPLDPDGVLQYEWLNARGAIARFDRQTIEIRLLDVQECPRADIAIAALVTEVVRALVEERWSSWQDQKSWPEDRLARILDATIRRGDEAPITDLDYLRAFGELADQVMGAGALWNGLVTKVLPDGARHELTPALDVIFGRGCLARRVLRAWDGTRHSLENIYRDLCDCLAGDTMFGADV
jgi:carboxylate-amine ligase